MRSLTRVRLTFIQDRVNVWLRFGRTAKERILSPRCRDVYFTPRATFACITWRGEGDRTLDWRVEILRSVEPAACASQVRYIDPGAEILLRVSGQSKVQTMLALFDSIEAQGVRLVSVSSDYWRCIHNRLAENQPVGVFSVDAQLAFQRRAEWEP